MTSMEKNTAPVNITGAIQMAQGAKAEKRDPGKTMKAYIAQMRGEIAKALPSVITPERFTRIVTSAISTTPMLAQTTPQSFLGAMMTAAQLGLEPNTPLGQAYLLPYKNKGVLECQFQLGYKGLIDLAYRSGQVIVIQAHEVREYDEFAYVYGLESALRHVPASGDRGNPTFYYGYFKTKGGGYGFDVMSYEDVLKHAKHYSKSYGGSFSPWATSFDEMAKKTVLKKCLKYAPMKSDFARALACDETIKTEIASDMSEVPAVEVDYTVDSETGEVLEGAGEAQQ